MNKIISSLIGDMNEKRAYKKNETRAKSLPREYADAYKEIKAYIFRTSGIETMTPLSALVDILEEAAANDRRVTDITGPDVAVFADGLVQEEASYFNKQRQKLNSKIAKKK